MGLASGSSDASGVGVAQAPIVCVGAADKVAITVGVTVVEFGTSVFGICAPEAGCGTTRGSLGDAADR